MNKHCSPELLCKFLAFSTLSFAKASTSNYNYQEKKFTRGERWEGQKDENFLSSLSPSHRHSRVLLFAVQISKFSYFQNKSSEPVFVQTRLTYLAQN